MMPSSICRWEAIRSVVLVMSIMVTANCAGVHRTPVNDSPLMEKEQVILKGFSNAVSISAVKAKANRLPSGRLQLRVQFIKEALGSDFVEIMTVFMDDAGFQLEKTNWEPLHMEQSVVTQYETTSLSSKAVDFRVVVRNSP